MAIFFPPPLPGRSRCCVRCGLNTPRDRPACQHCHGLRDDQLASLQQARDARHRHHRLTGVLFIVLALLIGAAMLL